MAKGSDSPFPSVLVLEGTTPASPSAGNQRLFVRSSDHVLCRVNSSGTVTAIEALTDPMTTRGDIIIRNAANASARLGIGSAGQVLKSDGTDIAWGASAAAALVFLEAHTASASASLDFTTFISSTYDTYLIEGVEVALATNTADLLMQIGTGGGPSYDAGTNYGFAMTGRNTNGTATNDNGEGATAGVRVCKSMSNNAGYGFGAFSLTGTGLQSTAHRKSFTGTVTYVDSAPNAIHGVLGGQWNTTATAATALRFIASSGNITSGIIRIYGYTKS